MEKTKRVKARQQQQASISVPKIRQAFKGEVIAPGDPDYDQARTVFPGGIDHRPVVIIRVQDAQEVARVIRLARDTDLQLAVRSGGHSSVGHCVAEGGIVLDLAKMRDLQFDVQRRTAWAGSGLTAGEFTTAAAEHGLATGFGDTGSVGIGGLTLGGGVGYLVRKHGLTIDNLLSAEIVTADGQILEIDNNSHPDLFWAIRGGGGNFGVVTRFQYRLQEIPSMVGGMLILPATPEVITGFIREAESAPDELSTIANVMKAPPMPFLPDDVHGKLIVMAMMVYAGEAEAGERVLAPFRALAMPLADMVKPMKYPEIYPPDDPSYHPMAASCTMFVNRIDKPVAELILEKLRESTGSLAVAQLRVLGGAMARIPADATAFAHRRSRILVSLAALYDRVEKKPLHETWVSEFLAALKQEDAGAYVNFLGEEGEERIRAAYPGKTWDRLREIKRRYDPENFFRLNQNIPPAPIV